MMTPQASREMERREIREAVHRSTAVESIGRRLGDELISAARETIRAYQDIVITTNDRRAFRRFERAIDRLVELVGRP